jgi:hypothetical protein
MQELSKEKLSIVPALGALDKISHDLRFLGYCSEQTKRQIIDEEKTHAAEIVASACYETDIPRNYYIKNQEVVDEHGVSLNNVLEKGINYIEDGHDKKPGWEWELKRRKSEKQNLEEIAGMPEGFACVEISSTDSSKSEGELKGWGYSGSTLIRFTYKNTEAQLIQRNIMVNTSDISILNKLRIYVDNGAGALKNSDELLASPIFISLNNDKLEYFAADIKNFIKKQESSKQPLNYLFSIIKKAKTTKTNSWDYVKDHPVFDEMFSEMVNLARNDNFSESDINLLRAGAWQVLLDGKLKNNSDTGSIDVGISKAMAIGAVFTSCGGTVSYEKENTDNIVTYFDRFSVASSLLNRINKLGNCKACGVTDIMYGCGVYCKSCNKIWCKEYISSGKQLSDKEVLQKKYVFLFWR